MAKQTRSTEGQSGLILFNKPFGVLSQFTDQKNPGATTRPTLGNYIQAPGFYPAGRLDRDSEGLLLLTDNGRLQSRISEPRFKLEKTYLVQVEGIVSEEALTHLLEGVQLKDGDARAVSARAHEVPDWLWPREPPVRFRKTVPDSWLELSINQGRNRQVRRMTAAVGLPTLRLIRTSIGSWSLDSLSPGEYQKTTTRL